MTMTTPTTLREFTAQDFHCFSGVETSSPLINFANGCVVVVDGKYLELASVDLEFDGFMQQYESDATAEAVGNAMLAKLDSGESIDSIVAQFCLQPI